MSDQIFNRPEYKQRRQELRNNMTEPEKRLWSVLRNKQLGVKFRRQHGIGHYIADFYSPEIRLVIELDGDSHFHQDAIQYDALRDEYMRALGIVVIRLLNQDVMCNFDAVLSYIHAQIIDRKANI